jgi:hypothetical protein
MSEGFSYENQLVPLVTPLEDEIKNQYVIDICTVNNGE